MTANTPTGLRLRLRKEAFDRRARRVFGANVRHYTIAEHLGTDPATLSLVRNGRREPTRRFITATLIAFGGDLDNWFEVADDTADEAVEIAA